MELTDQEQTVVENMWGEGTPSDLGELDTEQLVAMHDRVSKASKPPTDNDVDSLGILLPLEGKLIQVLHGRLW